MSQNPYVVLQIPQSASYEQIKQRYRHLSKLLHPDKQPLQNYQMAQNHFKKIDQAYKAISSRLRRYVYKRYGPVGINILDSAPFFFNQFQQADLQDSDVSQKLDQLLQYFMHEEHASSETDKNKLRTRTICMVFKPINKIDKLPCAQKSEFQFQTPLPDALGFSNAIKILHNSNNLSEATKSDLSFGLISSRRYKQAWLLNLNSNIMKDNYQCEVSIDRIFSPYLVAHFVPINFDDQGFGIPQVGVDSQFQNFYISTITDLQSFTLQIGSPPTHKSSSKTIKISMQGDSLLISPSYERQITPALKVFVQVQSRVQISGNATADLNGAISYGYKLNLNDQLKLELMSFVGVPQNYLQFLIMTPKYRVAIPIFCRSQQYKIELYKLAFFASVYMVYRCYNWVLGNNKTNRKRLEYESYNRLSVQKNTILKIINQSSVINDEIIENQKKYNGLIISLAYICSQKKSEKIRKIIKKKSLVNSRKYKAYTQQLEEIIKHIKDEIQTSIDNFDEQSYQIGAIIQSHVKGGHLFKFNCEQIGVNPCLNERQTYKSIILYWLNGQIKLVEYNQNHNIQISRLKVHYQKPLWSRMKQKIWRYLSH